MPWPLKLISKRFRDVIIEPHIPSGGMARWAIFITDSTSTDVTLVSRATVTSAKTSWRTKEMVSSGGLFGICGTEDKISNRINFFFNLIWISSNRNTPFFALFHYTWLDNLLSSTDVGVRNVRARNTNENTHVYVQDFRNVNLKLWSVLQADLK